MISIIVPVYNAECCIRKSVSSILGQTYRNFEIILIDDGSTDKSGYLCDSLSEESDRIKAFHKKNDGPNSARAFGLSKAIGEWVSFVDSDDTLPNDSLSTLAAEISEDTDLIVGYSFDLDESTHMVDIDSWRKSLIRSDAILCVPWGKLYRKKNLSENAFSLITDNRTGTDMPMNIKFAYSTDRPVTIVPRKVYNYNVINNSVSHSAKWTLSKIEKLYSEVLNSIPQEQHCNVMEQLIENRILAIKRKRTEEPVCGREHIKTSRYIDNLKNDILSSRYRLPLCDRMLVFSSDSIFTPLLCKTKRYLLVGEQFIKRKLGTEK